MSWVRLRQRVATLQCGKHSAGAPRVMRASALCSNISTTAASGTHTAPLSQSGPAPAPPAACSACPARRRARACQGHRRPSRRHLAAQRGPAGQERGEQEVVERAACTAAVCWYRCYHQHAAISMRTIGHKIWLLPADTAAESRLGTVPPIARPQARAPSPHCTRCCRIASQPHSHMRTCLGMMPPHTTSTCSMPAALSSRSSSGTSVPCPAAWLDTPTTCTSAGAGVWSCGWLWFEAGYHRSS